jgi:hypothetical protein
METNRSRARAYFRPAAKGGCGSRPSQIATQAIQAMKTA